MKGEKAVNLHTPESAAGLHANQNLGHSEHLGGLLGGFEELRLEPAGELRREHAACFEQKYILLKMRYIKKFSAFLLLNLTDSIFIRIDPISVNSLRK